MDMEQSKGQDSQVLNREVQDIWNEKAAFWDEKMAHILVRVF